MFGFFRSQFSKNSHGHVVFSVKGEGRTGSQEFDRLVQKKCEFGERVDSCLKESNFDSDHRLEEGRSYEVVLLPHKLIPDEAKRTPLALVELGAKFGYRRPLAGITLGIWESLAHRVLSPRGLGVYYVVPQHEPLKDRRTDRLLQMYVSSFPMERVGASILLNKPPATWNDQGASLFFL
jgi:hypothetical protein